MSTHERIQGGEYFPFEETKWARMAAWLRLPAGDFVCDEAVSGCWPTYMAEELLADEGIAATPRNLRRLALEIGRAVEAV